FHLGFDFGGNFAVEVVERSVAGGAEHVTRYSAAVLHFGDQFSDAGGDELHRAGEHAGSRFRQGEVLVSVHADGVSASLGGGGDRTVTGNTTTTEDRVRALVHHGLGGLCTPFGIREGLVEADITVVHNQHFGAGAHLAIGIRG